MSGIPDKPYYKIGEVCQLTDTQPYVLRFWESEFPQLAPEKSRSGQRMYTRRDIDLVFRIKKLLYEEEFTIAGARKRLETEEAQAAGSTLESLLPDGPPHRDEPALAAETVESRPEEAVLEPELETEHAPEPVPDVVEARPLFTLEETGPVRDEGLRERIRELEDREAALETQVAEARQAARRERERALGVADRLERILESLGGEEAGAP